MNDLVMNHQQEIQNLCKQFGITYLAAFGSRSRGDYKKDSDLDLLVTFNHNIGYFDLAEIEQKISKVAGVKVDLVTKGGLSKYVKPYIQDDLKIIYAQKS